ncbi:hypothetical protein D917_10621 [Trichinella nativa]|uniref:Uncharacterized protein n=1 Tax=Trichinella nativa TaxID=6335 RepID=A0A1Y3EFH4_9BILA|nr:hypothetical protein D917_10621 [Trichinella nativa]
MEQVEANFISSNFKSEWNQKSKQDDDVSVKLYFHLRDSRWKKKSSLFPKENSESSPKATKINEYYTESTQHKVWLNQLESVNYLEDLQSVGQNV